MSPRASKDSVSALDPHPDTRRILDALRRIVRDLRQPVGGVLGPARLFILQELTALGTLTIGELALRTHTDPSSVSVVVSELLKAGLVQRGKDPADQRRAAVSVTRAGRTAIKRSPPAAQQRIAAAIDALAPGRRRSLARLLDEVVDASGSDRRAPLFFEDAREARSKVVKRG